MPCNESSLLSLVDAAGRDTLSQSPSMGKESCLRLSIFGSQRRLLIRIRGPAPLSPCPSLMPIALVATFMLNVSDYVPWSDLEGTINWGTTKGQTLYLC